MATPNSGPPFCTMYTVWKSKVYATQILHEINFDEIRVKKNTRKLKILKIAPKVRFRVFEITVFVLSRRNNST